MADHDPASAGLALRVLSYNVHGQHDDTGALDAVVRGLSPDVVAVQEAPRRLRWRARCADLARRFGLNYAAGGLPALGNLLLTSHRVRVHRTWCVQFPLTPGRHMRGAALARCSIGRVPFVVAVTHLATDPQERPVQAAVLKKVMAEADAPVLLAGDLNETCGGAAWRTLADGLVDAAVQSGTERPTYPVAEPRARVDGIFVDPQFTVRDCRVVDSPQTRRASDHFPVVADLLLT